MQLTPNYVVTLRQRSLRDGTAGLIRSDRCRSVAT